MHLMIGYYMIIKNYGLNLKKLFLYLDHYSSKKADFIFNHSEIVNNLRNEYWSNKFISKISSL